MLEPDLYKEFHALFSEPFNPWKPKNLDFWEKQIKAIQKIQGELQIRAVNTNNEKKRGLLEAIGECIHISPFKRQALVPSVEKVS